MQMHCIQEFNIVLSHCGRNQFYVENSQFDFFAKNKSFFEFLLAFFLLEFFLSENNINT